MSKNIILAASAAVSTGVGSTKSKSNAYSKGCNLVINVTAISVDTNLSGYLQTSEDGTNFKDTCFIASVVTGDITSTVKSFAARFEGSIPQNVRIRWVRTGGAVTASAKLVFDD